METAENMDDTLVTLSEIRNRNNPWYNKEVQAKLAEQMDELSKLRIPRETVPDEVVDEALSEVLEHAGWNNYDDFRNTVDGIYAASRKYYRDTRTDFYRPDEIPFTYMSHNKNTRERDIWNYRVFVKINGNYGNSEKYGKKRVLMSREFYEKMKKFCKDNLRDEATFFIYTGTYRDGKNLNMNRVTKKDIDILKEIHNLDEVNANDFVMVKFMKKVNEVVVVAKKNGV